MMRHAISLSFTIAQQTSSHAPSLIRAPIQQRRCCQLRCKGQQPMPPLHRASKCCITTYGRNSGQRHSVHPCRALRAMACGAVPCGAVRCCTWPFCDLPCCAVLCSTLQCRSVYAIMLCRAWPVVMCCAALHCDVMCNAVLFSAVICCTACNRTLLLEMKNIGIFTSANCYDTMRTAFALHCAYSGN